MKIQDKNYTQDTNNLVNWIKKEPDVDVFSDYSLDKIEEKDSVEVVGSNIIQLAIDEYSRYLNLSWNERFLYETDIILTPGEINSFISLTNHFSEHNRYRDLTGSYLSCLINKSYQEGNNLFQLDLSSTPPMNNVLEGILSSEQKPLDIVIKGDVGTWCGRNSQCLTIAIDGSTGIYFGQNSNNLNVFVNGDVGDNFGSDSFRTKAFINGDVGKFLGSNSREIKVAVNGYLNNYFATGAYDGYCVVRQNIEIIPIYNTLKTTIISGKDAREDPFYQSMLNEGKRWFV